MAAERLAEAAIGAGGPAVIGLRNNGARCRERMQSELFCAGVEQGGRPLHHEWRQRVIAPARRLERVAALDLVALQITGLARHAKLVFGAIIIGLEIGIA